VSSVILMGTFLSILEISIVSTALVAITNDLKGFERSSWIITSYLLTYTGFLIIWAKFSDILGRRSCLAASMLIFIIASGACGASQTTNQLITFRAFQGIGAAGMVALNFVVMAEMVPAEKYALYSGICAIVYAIAYLLGPLVGGAISEKTTWRWVFLVNVPLGMIPLALLFVFMPKNFPHLEPDYSPPSDKFRSIIRIDFRGAVLLFGFCVIMVAAFQEANTTYPWSSAAVIVLLITSGLFLLGFIAWEKYLAKDERVDAIFPWRMMTNRIFMTPILLTILSGAPFTVAVIQIPQRYQAVTQTSAIRAGVDLLPFTLLLCGGSLIASVLGSKLRVPALYLFLVGAILQTVGSAMMSTLGIYLGPKVNGYEAILAVGLGLNLGMGILLTPQVVEKRDHSAAMGAITQARPLGGAIGLAITTTVLNSYIKSSLRGLLTPEQLGGLLESIDVINFLPPEQQAQVRQSFSHGYNLQMKVMIGFSAAQILVVALMWEKTWRRVA